MNEKAEAYVEGQLKKVGMLDSKTPELMERMKAGDPFIQHVFKKDYDDGSATVTQHWKKSATTDHYFLNKYDSAVQVPGKEEQRNHTFYLSFRRAGTEGEAETKKSTDVNFTLKESFNLLSDRPVMKMAANKAGELEPTWYKLNLDKKLDNGNYEMNTFRPGYGFELDRTLKNYQIREQLTPEYKSNLMESLQRGNLQKVTMLGADRKEEKVYVSPSIKGSFLKVYDLDKKPVPLEEQLKRQWITPEFHQHLKEVFNRKQQPVEQKVTEQKPKETIEKAPKPRKSRSVKKNV